MMNHNDMALKFNSTIRILFIFGQIIPGAPEARPAAIHSKLACVCASARAVWWAGLPLTSGQFIKVTGMRHEKA